MSTLRLAPGAILAAAALVCSREATYACCSTNPVPAGRASARPRVAGRNQGAGTASGSRSTTSSTRLPCCVRSNASFRGDIVTGRGGSQILLDDPAGNVIELFQPPSI